MNNKIRSKTIKANRRSKPESKGRLPVVMGKKGITTNIKNKEAYELVMKEIEVLMKKGEENLTIPELSRLKTLADAAEGYEDAHEPLPIPSTLADMIRMKMFQLRLKQHFTAKLLGVSEAKFSLIMNGKQRPDIYFIKALHEKLNMDANQIIKAI